MKNQELLNATVNNKYSQNGEDGVIELLNSKFGIENGSFCEFGAWDGIHLSNTYNLLENKNWKGVYIEGDQDKYRDLIKLHDKYPDRIQTINSYVSWEGKDTLDNLLENTFLDINFDLLSIDVDGLDYHIWKAFIKYRPKIVIIEANSNIRPGNFYIHEIDNENRPYIGTGFSALCELGIKKGYYPIIHFGNIFFGEIDFLKEKKYDFNLDINSMYNWNF